jgi:DNA-binding response OmpR family regulator
MRILVIEDEEKLADTLRRGLSEQGYAVDTAGDGEEGLTLALTETYALVVLDLMLPRLDGYTVCRRLRAAGRQVPVLMLTARDAVDDRVEGLDAGADDYLVKPFAFHELLARIRALRRRNGQAQDSVLRARDLELNTATREVQRGGRPIELTTKEYAILEYFLRNPNRVLDRGQIAEHVWDYDLASMSNVIDVYIGYLRRKLGDDQEPRLIHTVRGAGYQLRVPRA